MAFVVRLSISALSLLVFLQARSQGVEFSAGMGLPETPNIGVRYYNESITTGMSYGFISSLDLRTINLDFGVHYGKPAKKSVAKKSVGRIMYTNYREETNTRIFKYSYITLRAGRNFFFSNDFGLNLEGGISFQVGEDVENKSGTFDPTSLFIDFDVMPSASLRFLYRLAQKNQPE